MPSPSPARLVGSFGKPVLIVALIAFQLPTYGYAAAASSTSRTHAAVVLLAPGAALSSAFAGQEGAGEGHGAGRPRPPARPVPPRPAAAAGSCSAAFCPWRAVDALGRAGRFAAPTTAPPRSV